MFSLPQDCLHTHNSVLTAADFTFADQGHPHLVVLTPGPGSRSGEAEEDEGILTADDERDGEELQVGDQVSNKPEERSQLCTGDLHTEVKQAGGTNTASSDVT